MMKEAFSLFLQKIRHSSSFKLDCQVFTAILKSCSAISDLNLGKAIHSHVVKLGHGSCQLVTKAILNMYAKCKSLDDCQKLFHQMRNCDTVMWNIVLSGLAGSRLHDHEAMRLFHSMHVAQDPKPSIVTLAIILPLCGRSGVSAGQSLHCYATKVGLDSDTLVSNALISMYAKSGLVLDASFVFQGIADKDVVSWNAIISGFIENGLVTDAFEMFQWMAKCQHSPNYATIANILPICACVNSSAGYYFGKEIHSYVLKRAELAVVVTVVNALLIFYLRIGQTINAETLFKRMKFRDVVSWNSMIAGYSSNGEWLKALKLFHEFLHMEMIGPDSITLVSVLPACAQSCNLQAGKQVHGYVFRHAILHQDTAVQNALISFYTRCGCMGSALQTFSLASKKDVISWNSTLDALNEHNLETQFINLLHRMFREAIKPDSITILTVIQFCTKISRMDKVKESHGFSITYGLFCGDTEPTVRDALLDAYAKCGNLEYAHKMFENVLGKRNVVPCNSMNLGYQKSAEIITKWMSERDLTTWNLMVRIYAENSCPSQALSVFCEMQHHGVKPDSMTIMGLLPVCAQIASIHTLRQCHGYVTRACFEDVHLNGSLLDVYSKCGNISSAYKIFQSTSNKDLVLFTAMIGGFAMHGLGEEAIGVFNHMLELGLNPDHVILTTVLSACSHAGLVDEGLNIFDSIEQVHRMKPSMEQYACVVDLLARGGRINEALSFVTTMPVEANANIWATLLGACKIHHDFHMARSVADCFFDTNSSDIGNYVAMSNLYAANARWEGVQEIRRLMRMKDLKKPAGCSWIELENRKNVFVAGDYSHPQRGFIYRTLSTLDKQIKELYESSSSIL